jgi:hypothetical protein
VRQGARGGQGRARAVAREEHERTVVPEHTPPFAESRLRRAEVLDDEVGVDEVERPVVEGKPLAEVGGDEAVEGGVFVSSDCVEVDADELGDVNHGGRRGAS